MSTVSSKISLPPNFPLLFCCFIYLSTFIFYIVEYSKKGKGKTNEKKVMMSLMLMTFLSAVEGTIVSTAIPRITSDLSGVELVSWVYAIYMLATAVSTPIYGKLADLFGRKKVLLIGATIFLIGSALCGVVTSMEQLIFFRALQGIGVGCCYADHNDDYWRPI